MKKTDPNNSTIPLKKLNNSDRVLQYIGLKEDNSWVNYKQIKQMEDFAVWWVVWVNIIF